MPLFSGMIFAIIRCAARNGLGGAAGTTPAEQMLDRRMRARRTGVRGNLRVLVFARHGYEFVSRNYMPRGAKGEIDLIGYAGETLVFVEVRTRTVREGSGMLPALPELSITTDKHRVVARTAMRFLTRAAREGVSVPVRCAGDRQPGWDGT